MINVNRMLRGIDWKAYGPYSDQQSQGRALIGVNMKTIQVVNYFSNPLDAKKENFTISILYEPAPILYKK
jgi:hypothetical protein